MNTKAHLIAAKALIDKPEKWVKGEARVGECYCAIGALNAISPPPYGDDCFPTDSLYVALSNALPDGECFVARFNDAPGTTHSDVMALFDRAIAAQDVTA